LILVGLQLHPGTVVPIYIACLPLVRVRSCVAFTLLVQNYSCTNLPRTYTVVHNLLCTTPTIILLVPISLILPPKIHFHLAEIHSHIIIASYEYETRLKSIRFPGTSFMSLFAFVFRTHASLRICILFSYLPSPSYFVHVSIFSFSVQYSVVPSITRSLLYYSEHDTKVKQLLNHIKSLIRTLDYIDYM
jgi:hypothetical protein